MPKVDLDTIPSSNATSYPMPYAADMTKRHVRRIGRETGLKDFGVAHVELEPGGISSQRHWHEGEDEFVVMLSGEAVLVEDDGEIVLRPGDCAVFPKGIANGHHLVNRSDRPCAMLAFGRPPVGPGHYSDIDLYWDGPWQRFTRKDGSRFDI